MGNSAYTDHEYEDAVFQANINLLVARKSNSKRPHSRALSYLTTHLQHFFHELF